MLIDGIITNCSDKNNIKVKLRNGTEVSAKGEFSANLKTNQRVWLFPNQVISGYKSGFPVTKVSSYSVVGTKSSFEDSFTSQTYSV